MENSRDMLNQVDNHVKEDNATQTNGDEEDDLEDVDDKAKALTNLLKTSSVSGALAGSSPMFFC
jgi:hypothetical protein